MHYDRSGTERVIDDPRAGPNENPDVFRDDGSEVTRVGLDGPGIARSHCADQRDQETSGAFVAPDGECLITECLITVSGVSGISCACVVCVTCACVVCVAFTARVWECA